MTWHFEKSRNVISWFCKSGFMAEKRASVKIDRRRYKQGGLYWRELLNETILRKLALRQIKKNTDSYI